MSIDAASHFAGKRKSERKKTDLPVELRGGGIVLQGQAIDISQDGVGVLLQAKAFQSFRAPSGNAGTMNVLQRHFTSGVEVRFPMHGDVRAAAQLIRVITPPKRGAGDLTVGCKFNRALSPEEWAYLNGLAPPAPSVPLSDLTPGPAVQLLVFDPTTGPAAGPLYLLQVVRGSTTSIEAVVQASRPVAADDVRAELDRGAIPARMTSGGGLTWDGSIGLAGVTTGTRGEAIVRFDALTPWSPQFLKRIGKPK